MAGPGPAEMLEQAFLDYCDLNLHQPVKTFGDAGGPDDGAWREYQLMIEFMRASGSSFLVVVPHAGHLGVDLESACRSVVQLERDGAKVTCANEGYPDPLQNALQVLGVKGVSQARSDRIKESMKVRALKGQGLGRPPYGYRNGTDGTPEVVRDEAAVVELIYRLYTKDGLGLRLIAQHLNERGVRTRRGGTWNLVALRDMLRNPAYTGTYTRFGLRIPKSHEAIIAPGVFRQVQDRMRTRRPVDRVVAGEPFVLSGLTYCGYCDNKMMGVTRRQKWRRKDGRRARGVYRYYQCQARNNQSICGYHTWRASLLEDSVLTQLKCKLEDRSDSSGSYEAAGYRRKAITALWDKRTRNAERRFVQAVRRASRGEVGMKVVGDYLVDLDRARAGAREAERPRDVAATFADWDSLGVSERQGFLMEHVGRIVVKEDSVEVTVA